VNSRIEKGIGGESLVALHLMQEGYTILHRNYRKSYGEVDIIAQKDDVIAFVEVKWRKSPLIDPAEVITLSKQKKITTIAKLFLSLHTNGDVVCRFDAALIEEHNNSLELRYIPNAFSAFD